MGKKIISTLEYADLSSDYIGVRSKLFINKKIYEDYLITESRKNDLFAVHLLGIESPGLTSLLAIAEEIASKIE